MSDGGRHWNYGGLEEPSSRPPSGMLDRGSARKPRKVPSKNDMLEENHRLISDDEDHTELTNYRNSQSVAYYQGDTGTDVEMEYAASGSLDGMTFSPFSLCPSSDVHVYLLYSMLK